MTTMPLAASVKGGLLAAGWYANRLEHDVFPGVLGLCYHGLRASASDAGVPFANLHVIAETFEAHCRVMAETCHPIDLETFCAAQGGGSLPDRPVLVTFDDGYRSVFELARPILKRYRIPAAVFVNSEPVKTQRLFWFDAVARARGEEAVSEMRALPDEGWRQASQAFDTPAGAAPHLAPMTESQVRQLADEGVAIGVHSASHAPLGGAPVAVQEHELASCRAALETWTGRPADTLAYPFGAPQLDYDEGTIAVASRLGFRAGFTTRQDFARPAEPSLERSRFVMLASITAAELAHRIAYSWRR